MTDFIFARLGLSDTSFSIPNAPGKKNNITGFNPINSGIVELQRDENHPLSTDLDELYSTIRLMIKIPNPGVALNSNTSILQNCNTLQVQHPNCFNRSVFCAPLPVLCVQHSLLNCD